MADSRAEEAERIRYMYGAYREQYETISDRLDSALEEAQRLSMSIGTLEGYDMIRGSNSFMQVGDGLFLKSKVEDSGNFLIYVGGGYMIEAGLETSKEIISSRLEEVNSFMKKLYSERENVAKILSDLGERLAENGGEG